MTTTHPQRLTPADYFDTALRILGEQSHDDLTIAHLCEELGVSKGSFYHHFGGWTGFVEALLEHWERESTLTAMELAARIEDPKDRRRIIAGLIDTVPHDAEGAIRVWSRSDPLVKAVQDRVDEERISMMTDLLVLELSTGDARALAELHHTVLVSCQIVERPASVKKMRAMIRMLTELVTAKYGPKVSG